MCGRVQGWWFESVLYWTRFDAFIEVVPDSSFVYVFPFSVYVFDWYVLSVKYICRDDIPHPQLLASNFNRMCTSICCSKIIWWKAFRSFNLSLIWAFVASCNYLLWKRAHDYMENKERSWGLVSKHLFF